jgi:hypothetical protein
MQAAAVMAERWPSTIMNARGQQIRGARPEAHHSFFTGGLTLKVEEEKRPRGVEVWT